MTIRDFAGKIELLKELFPFSVTSWFRSKKRNAAVGGHPQSKHLTGFAVDVVLDDPKDTPQFLRTVNALGLGFLEEDDHIHIQRRFL